MSQGTEKTPPWGWFMHRVLTTLDHHTLQIGRVEGRLIGLENEAINRVKDLEARERERPTAAAQTPRQPFLAVLEALRAIAWRDIILLTGIAFAALTGQWDALRKLLGLE